MPNEAVKRFKSYSWLMVVVIGALVFNLASWVWVKKASSDFLDKSTRLAGLSQKRVNLGQIKREHGKVITQRSAVIKSFLPKDNIIAFILFLEDLARRTNNGVDIQAVSQSQDDNSDKDILNFKVELSGSYPSFVNFLNELANSHYLAAPSKIEISRNVDPESRRTLFKASLELKTVSF